MYVPPLMGGIVPTISRKRIEFCDSCLCKPFTSLVSPEPAKVRLLCTARRSCHFASQFESARSLSIFTTSTCTVETRAFRLTCSFEGMPHTLRRLLRVPTAESSSEQSFRRAGLPLPLILSSTHEHSTSKETGVASSTKQGNAISSPQDNTLWTRRF